MTATVPSMIGQFNMSNIQLLQDIGYEVDVACDFNDRSVWNEERVKKFIEELDEKNINHFQIDYSRNPLDIKRSLKAYRQLCKLFINRKYVFSHCHTPVASVLCRIVSHKMKVKCIYTAHGFHFYKGAPLKNWGVFYPIEKLLSYWTDTLITINKEDYKRAKKSFKAKHVEYVPGIGIDIEKIDKVHCDRNAIRNELGVSENEIMLFSVGELSSRKNHEIVIRAIKAINNKKIKYFIAGQGSLKDELTKVIEEENLEENIHLLGYRTDVIELCKASDIFVFPSKQEGLPVALMEAIACKVPVICSKIRGNIDLVHNDNCLFDCNSMDELKVRIKCFIDNNTEHLIRKLVQNNYTLLEKCDINNVRESMSSIYRKFN